MCPATQVVRAPHPFVTEAGAVLDDLHIAYQTYGTLNAAGTNAVLIEHALTGDAHVASGQNPQASPRGGAPSGAVPASGAGSAGESDAAAVDDTVGLPGWWEGVVGPGRGIDTDEYFVVCANVLGGCAGTTGPTSMHADGLPYGSRFPHVSIRDMVSAEIALSDALGIDTWHAVVGGSMGGARVLEWTLMAPDRVKKASVLAAPAYSQADQIAWAHTQIDAIMLDPHYHDGDYRALDAFPAHGLGLARKIAHLTYRADHELNQRFSNTVQNEIRSDWCRVRRDQTYFSIMSYLDYQAGKLSARFDPLSYVLLTQALAEHDVRRGRESDLRAVLARTQADFQVTSVSSDRLYTPRQVAEVARALPGEVDYAVVESDAGHDGFLTEAPAVSSRISAFLAG